MGRKPWDYWEGEGGEGGGRWRPWRRPGRRRSWGEREKAELGKGLQGWRKRGHLGGWGVGGCGVLSSISGWGDRDMRPLPSGVREEQAGRPVLRPVRGAHGEPAGRCLGGIRKHQVQEEGDGVWLVW